MSDIDFRCHVCGAECPIAPDPPARAVCEEHCEDHQYEYDKWRRGKFCVHCDKEREHEPCEDDVPISFARPPSERDKPLGTPLSKLSTRPGEPGYEEWCRIARSWGYD